MPSRSSQPSSPTKSSNTQFYDPTHHEQTYQKFLFIYLPTLSFLVRIVGYLILIGVLIPDAIIEYTNLGTLPPQQSSTYVNEWSFPDFYLCTGQPRDHDIELIHETNCDTFYESGANASQEYPCNISSTSFDFPIFNEDENLQDECFQVNVNDQTNYNTTLMTTLTLKQNVKLPVVNSTQEFPSWLLQAPSTIRGTFLDSRNILNVTRNAFQVFPSTCKMTLLIQEEIEDQTVEFKPLDPEEITKDVTSSIVNTGADTSSRYTYKYSMFFGSVGKYGNAAICFPFNATHEDCSTYFELDVRIRMLGDSRLRKSIISSQQYWRTWLGSVAGKFSLGQTAILLLVLLLESIIFRWCFNKKSERDINVDLYKRLVKLQEKKVMKRTDNADLEEELLVEDEDQSQREVESDDKRQQRGNKDKI
mmetsp:Transcript_11437/g.42953  ORF Transcript_11437/g.42953 Transcript_11437/m.42953 type:complete len:419 (-) Transcript_11437:218-1474(-)